MKKSICTTVVSVALLSAAVLPAGASPAPASVDMSTKLLGRTVFLDPGHQGGGSPSQLARMVDNGRGGAKACQTTGMTAVGGVPEHTITWQVAQLVKTSLASLGAKVVLSRADDTGWGGCVTDRAQAADASHADVALSIHADGAAAADHGFHFIVPKLPIPNSAVNQVQSTRGLAATRSVRDAYLKYGFQPANYAGVTQGLQTRADIAGPALTTVPAVFVEMGNGRNPDDAKQLTTPEGQVKHAIAITAGLVGFLLGVKPGGVVEQRLPDGSVPADPGATIPGATSDGSTSNQAGALPNTAQTGANPAGVNPDGPGQAGADGSPTGLGSTVTQLLRPLLQMLGLDSTVGSLLDTVGPLLIKALSAVLGTK